MKSSVIRARIDDDLKARASEVLEACGLDPSVAIRLFMQEVVKRGGIPFAIRSGRGVSVVAPARLLKMKRAAQARDRAIAASDDLSGGQMLLIRPEQARDAKVRWPAGKLSG
jgi:DNA-damage-inducible protein J